MHEKQLSVKILVYENESELPAQDVALIQSATHALAKSYSPYSGFKVGSAAQLANGAVISGANQENASYPVCVCAEVVMLSACSAMHPGVAINSVAITTSGAKLSSTSPKAPCGQCRQTLLEFEMRQKSDIAIIMNGGNGEVYKVNSVKELLPLYFSDTDL